MINTVAHFTTPIGKLQANNNQTKKKKKREICGPAFWCVHHHYKQFTETTNPK